MATQQQLEWRAVMDGKDVRPLAHQEGHEPRQDEGDEDEQRGSGFGAM